MPLNGIEVLINGQGPFRFGLDTGASGSAWVSPELATLLDLPVVDRINIHDAYRDKGTPVEIVRIDTLAVGKVSYHNLSAFVTPQQSEDEQKNPSSRRLGTLGFELFEHQLVTLDFPRNELVIQNGSLPEPDGKTILLYKPHHTTPVIRIRLGKLKTTAEVDTGGAGAVMVPLSMAKTLSLDSPLKREGQIETSLGRSVPLYTANLNGDLVIGDFTFQHPKLLCSDLLGYVNLGRDLLHGFAITFDQRNHRLRFLRAATEESRTALRPSTD